MGAVIWMWRGAVQAGRGRGFDGVGFEVWGPDQSLSSSQTQSKKKKKEETEKERSQNTDTQPTQMNAQLERL